MMLIGAVFGVVFILCSNLYYQREAERKVEEAVAAHTVEIDRLLALLVEARAKKVGRAS